MVAIGLAAGQLLAPDVLAGVPLVRLLGTGAVTMGVLVIFLGLYRYRVNRDRIDRDTFQPAGHAVEMVALAIIPVALLAMVFVWLIRARPKTVGPARAIGITFAAVS